MADLRYIAHGGETAKLIFGYHRCSELVLKAYSAKMLDDVTATSRQ